MKVSRVVFDYLPEGVAIVDKPWKKYRILCPFHDDDRGTFEINNETGLCTCREKRCGWRGNAVAFVMSIDRISDSETAWRFIKNQRALAQQRRKEARGAGV